MKEPKLKIILAMAYSMNSATKVKRQRVISRCDYASISKLKEYLHFIAPTDVVFDEFNVVQPDVFMVGYRVRITEDNIRDVPDFVMGAAVSSNLKLNIVSNYV